MNAAVFYTATSAFAGGIFIRSFIELGLPEITAVMVLAVALAAVWRESSAAAFAPQVLLASVAFAAAALGMVRMEVASWSIIDPLLEQRVGEEVVLEGVITREPDVRETTTHLYIDTGEETVLAITDRFGAYAYGDRVAVEGELTKPEAFETDLGRTFDYAGYLQARGVSYQILFGDVEHIQDGAGNSLIAALLMGKHYFMQSLERIVPEPHAGLAEGLLLGEKRALGEELETVFRRTGIIHIVVLSGYNVMLVVTFVMYIFAYLFGLRLRITFGLIAIGAFAILVGLSATVVRASIMASLVLFARATGRAYEVTRALVFAGVLMLVLNPYLLAFDTGFQLSFLATLGLILIAPFVEEQLGFVPTHEYIGVREFLTATLATQFFVLPILLYQIGEFSVVSVVVNVLVLPMVPVAMFLTFLTGTLAFVSTALALPVAYAAYLSLVYILEIARWFSELPFAAYAVPAFPFWVVPVAYAVMGYGIWRLWNKSTDARSGEDLHGWTIVSENELLGIRR